MPENEWLDEEASESRAFWRRPIVYGAAAGALVVVVAAVLVGREVWGDGQGNPELNARRWVQALISADSEQLAGLTCAGRQTELKAGALIATVVGVVAEYWAGPIQPDVNVKRMDFKTVNRKGTDAKVAFSGVIQVGVRFVTRDFDVSQTMPMRYENHQWTFCP